MSVDTKYYCRKCEEAISRDDKTCLNGHDIKTVGRRVELNISEDIVINDILLNKYFDDLLISKNMDEDIDVYATILKLMKINEPNVLNMIISRIEKDSYDNNNWITLSHAINDLLNKEEASNLIFQKLIEHNKENPAFFNNYGIFLRGVRKYDEALFQFIQGYVIEYKNKGEKGTKDSISWNNIITLAKWMNEGLTILSEIRKIVSDDEE